MKDNVRAAREARGWSQVELATKAGVSPASVTRIERGLAPEDGDSAKKVLAALGLSHGGRSLSAAQNSSVTTEPAQATLPSTMAQMVGSLQLPAGAEDYYTEMVQLALERGEAGEVFKELAKARVEAPPDARAGWWMRRFFAAIERAKQASSRK